MPHGIKINPVGFSLANKPLFPEVSRDELGQSFAPISQYKLLLKGLSCGLSWGELILSPGEAAEQLHASRSVIKLSASTFTIPKLAKKTVEVYDSAKKVQLCVQNNPAQIRKVIQAVAALFLATISFTNKSSKVLFALHKTRVINLNQIADSASEHLDKISFVTSLPALFLSVRKLASLVQRYLKMEQESEKKNDLRIKIATRSFKLFCSTLGFASYFFPTLVPPVVGLGLSTISFSISLGSSIADSEWGRNRNPSQAPIALKMGVV